MRRLFFLLAVIDLAVVGWAVYDETVTRRPWKRVQAEWNVVRASRGLPAVPIEIRQVTTAAAPTADRCQTCHLAAAEDGFGEPLPAHLRTHPRRAELLGAHAPERFGCTPCHQGQGLQTKGVGRAAFQHGRDDPSWERPLLRGALAEASCLDCHEEIPAGAPVLARGRKVFEDLRCGGCHLARHAEPAARAPSLAGIEQKTSQAFVEAWLRDPRAIRERTRMPGFWPVPLDPASGNPAAEGSERHRAWLGVRDAEPRAIAAYLGSLTDVPLPALPAGVALPASDDAAAIAEGKRLFDRVGCRGCHALGTEAAPAEARHGPSLDAVGEKATRAWLAAWLARPSAVWADARMPDLRLSPREIAPLVAFLSSLRRVGAPAAEARWTAAEPAVIAAGKKAIERLGCAGCHDIPGITRTGRPGPDLDAFGDKTREELTLGDARLECPDGELACFAEAKVRWPRRLEGNHVAALAMPDPGASAEDARALTVFLLAQRERQVAVPFRRPLDGKASALAAGERVLARHNCRGCHETGRDARGEPIGGAIRRFYADPALGPPPLSRAGQKLQYAWLWEFLRAPRTVRPYLEVRMPRFSLPDEEIDALGRYFATRAGEPYPVQRQEAPRLAESERKDALRLFATLKCGTCHPPPGLAPGAAPRAGNVAELGPDLALVPERLKPAWVRAWLEDPQTLQPDTRMPTFFPPEEEGQPKRTALPGFFGDDAGRQIAALVALLIEPRKR